MTLNITVLGRDTIYQSADYMLSDIKSGKSIENRSTKVVVLNNFEWTGFITYTGIGSVGKKDTAQIVEEWIDGNQNKTLDEIAELIRVSSTKWLRSVRLNYRHTFVIAAFIDGDARAIIVSNYQKYHGKDTDSIKRDFFVSEVKAKDKTQVIVTGIRDAVPRFLKKLIQHMVDSNEHDPSRIRRIMADTNKEGAQQFPDQISQDCFVYSQRVDGTGHYEPFGNTPANPQTIIGGESILKELFGGKSLEIKGMTSGRSGKVKKVTILECNLKIVQNSKSENYEVVQLEMPESMKASPRCYNEKHKLVAGQAKPLQGQPSYPCIWEYTGELKFIKHGGGLGGVVNSANNDLFVGFSEWPDRASRACKWTFDEQFIDIGSNFARYSSALACDDQGTIVGWISIHDSLGGQQHFRPAVWHHSGKFKVIRDLSGGWGVAVDIEEKYGVLVRAHAPIKGIASSPARPLLWKNNEQIEIGLPHSNCNSMWPKKITRDGGIIGLAIMENGSRTAYLRRPDESWKRLFEPKKEREFINTNKSGTIIGREMVNRYSVPWIKSQESSLQRLPYFMHHHHDVSYISNNGVIVGRTYSDHCSHPIAWIPKNP